MADIFDELEEDMRRERMEKFWKKYSKYIFAAAAALILGVGGYRLFDYFETKKAQDAGAQFEAALQLSQDKKGKEAEIALSKVITESNRYKDLARLTYAGELSKADKPRAISLFETLAQDANVEKPLRDLSSLRAAYLASETASYEEMKKRLEPLIGKELVFRQAASELLALSAMKEGKKEEAMKLLTSLVIDLEISEPLRGRVNILMNVLNGK